MSQEHDVKLLCKILNINRSTYYKSLYQVPSKRSNENKVLSQQILSVFAENKGRYGSIRIREALSRKGIKSSQKRVLKIMKMLNLRPVTIKKYRPASSKACKDAKPNIINQNFIASKPNKKWLSDITYIHTVKNGWTYLALILDLYSRKIIGYEYSTSMDAKLVVNAVKKAISQIGKPENLILHSDLGSQYISIELEKLLSKHAITHSFSKKGYPYDNSPMESFNASLKKEEVYLTLYPDYETARLALFQYIEGYYNCQRLHSGIGYHTLIEYERAYFKSLKSR